MQLKQKALSSEYVEGWSGPPQLDGGTNAGQLHGACPQLLLVQLPRAFLMGLITTASLLLQKLM
jgi:hypothetical protein